MGKETRTLELGLTRQENEELRLALLEHYRQLRANLVAFQEAAPKAKEALRKFSRKSFWAWLWGN